MIWLKSQYDGWRREYSDNPVRIGRFIDDLFACRKFDTWMLDRLDVERQINLYKPVDFSGLCTVVYAAYGAKRGKKFKVWGDKNNFYLNHIPGLRSLYANGRFLHIVRDGRDVACSYREVMASGSSSPYAPKLNTDIAHIAGEWAGNVNRIDTHLASMPSHNAMTIKYENLVECPRTTIQSVCLWLGVPLEKQMLDFYQENLKSKLEPEQTLDWKKRTLRPISNETVGRYAHLLQESELESFMEIAGTALRRFSYA